VGAHTPAECAPSCTFVNTHTPLSYCQCAWPTAISNSGGNSQDRALQEVVAQERNSALTEAKCSLTCVWRDVWHGMAYDMAYDMVTRVGRGESHNSLS
jgi:hypothetical protein